MSIVPFSFKLAQQIYSSTERFPVHFDDAWQWMEYSTKGNAKRLLEKNFTRDEDYQVIKPDNLVNRPQGGGSQPEEIWLAVNCFKEMGMMAGTEKGRQIRQYFIQCEEKLKGLLQSQCQQPTIRDELDVINLCLSAGGLDPKLTAGVMLNHAGVRMPQLKGAIAESHGLLAACLESDLLLTPTKIGKELGVSARRVNQILLDLGYQIKNLSKSSKTEPDYLVTDIGSPFAGNTLATGKLQEGKADNSTYQHLKWKPDVVEIVREHLAI